jgi:hypothetical protein
MKKTQMLPLAAMISGLLVGCGGGGGGGGGGGTPADNVTLEFVQMYTSSSVQSSCTLFKVDDLDNPTLYTYAKVAQDLVVYTHDAEGSVTDTLTPNSSGKLTINKNTLDDGGFVTVLDSPGETDYFYKALSIQKEILESQLIKVGRNQGNVGCYSDNQARNTVSGNVIVSTINAQADSYQYLSTLEDDSITPSNSVAITAYDNESVLVKGYFSGSLNGYSFVDSIGASPSIAELEGLDTLFKWSNQLPTQLSSLTINVDQDGYNYEWFKPDTTSVEAFDISSLISQRSFIAAGTLSSNWDFHISGRFSGTLDVNTSESLTILDVSPNVSQSGTTDIIEITGVSSDERLVARGKYTQSAASPIKTLEHIVVSELSNGRIIIPDLGLADLTPQSPDSLSVTVFETGSLEDSVVQNLVSQYEDVDTVASVIAPADRTAHTYDVEISEYMSVTR